MKFKVLPFLAILGMQAHAGGPLLGTAQSYAVLGGETVTNTGPTVLWGDLGVSPGSAITGFPPGIVMAPGMTHAADAAALQAQNDVTTAYDVLAGMTPAQDSDGSGSGWNDAPAGRL
jgi:hypothetical protein